MRFNWVILNKLCIGSPPINSNDISQLKGLGIKSVINLCYENEILGYPDLESKFNYSRISLPDHKVEKLISYDDLKLVYDTLEDFLRIGPVYIHCLAAVERSPLICIGYLIKNKKLSLIEALEYMMSIHEGTNPSTKDLNLVKDFFNSIY